MSQTQEPTLAPIASSEVHVWQASLQLSAAQVAVLYATLSADERQRAERYRSPRDRQRFVAARGLLRAILRVCLGCEARQVRFRYSPHGKPELDTTSFPIPTPRLQFSLSHSDDLALYAVARGRRVGVDLERTRPGFTEDTLAESWFSVREVAALRSLPAAEQQRAFFVYWTRKEAYLKARGEGLVIPMDPFGAALAAAELALRQTPDPDESEGWSFCNLDAGPDHVAALAVEGHGWQLHQNRADAAMLIPIAQRTAQVSNGRDNRLCRVTTTTSNGI